MKSTHSSSARGRRLALTFALLTFAAALLAPAFAAATQIWLYPDGDDPREGGHVVDRSSFTLYVENRGGGPGDGLAEDMELIIAVADPALLSSVDLAVDGGSSHSLAAGDFAEGVPTLPCSGRGISPHGWYPAPFAAIELGDLAEDEIVSIDVTIVGEAGLEMHFDAIGIGSKQAGKDVKCFDIVNPSGHDVSVVFEGEDEGEGEEDCPDLSVEKEADLTGADMSSEVNYLITVANEGSCDLNEVVVDDQLPSVTDENGDILPAVTVLEAAPVPGTWDELQLIWNVGVLPAGEVVTMTITAVFDEELANGEQSKNTACVAAAELEEPQCDSAGVALGNVDEDFGGPGFWCNQIRFTTEERRNAKFTDEELNAWLLQVDEGSIIFSELWPLAGLEDASALLCYPSTAEGAADRLVRHLLSLWLNTASGRLPTIATLGELCDGEQETPEGIDPAMTIADLIAAVEADLAAGAEDEVLGWWQEIVDWVNSTHLCQGEPRRMGGRRR